MKRLLCLLCLLALPGFVILQKPAVLNATIRTQHGTVPLVLEIASTPAQRETGLMHRKTMGAHDGMVFIFPEPNSARFWMKNTLIPLDMLFIDETGEIRYIEHNAPPQNLTPRGQGDAILSVIELDGGRAERESIAVGDKVHYALPESLEVR